MDYGSGLDSVSNRNEYQECLVGEGWKRPVLMTDQVLIVWNFCGPQPKDLYRDSFTPYSTVL